MKTHVLHFGRDFTDLINLIRMRKVCGQPWRVDNSRCESKKIVKLIICEDS